MALYWEAPAWLFILSRSRLKSHICKREADRPSWLAGQPGGWATVGCLDCLLKTAHMGEQRPSVRTPGLRDQQSQGWTLRPLRPTTPPAVGSGDFCVPQRKPGRPVCVRLATRRASEKHLVLSPRRADSVRTRSWLRQCPHDCENCFLIHESQGDCERSHAMASTPHQCPPLRHSGFSCSLQEPSWKRRKARSRHVWKGFPKMREARTSSSLLK